MGGSDVNNSIMRLFFAVWALIVMLALPCEAARIEWDDSSYYLVLDEIRGNFFGDGTEVKIDLLVPLYRMWSMEELWAGVPDEDNIYTWPPKVGRNGEIKDSDLKRFVVGRGYCELRVTAPEPFGTQFCMSYRTSMSAIRYGVGVPNLSSCDVDGDGIPEIFFWRNLLVPGGGDINIASLKGGRLWEFFGNRTNKDGTDNATRKPLPSLKIATELFPDFKVLITASAPGGLNDFVTFDLNLDTEAKNEYIASEKFTNEGEPKQGAYFKLLAPDVFPWAGVGDIDSDGRDEVYCYIKIDRDHLANIAYKWNGME
jgi:hypothetical protein